MVRCGRSCNTLTQLLIIIIALVNIVPTAAQPSAISIGIGLGGAFTGYREETEAEINRYFNTLTYNIDGAITKGNFLHSLNAHFFSGNALMAAPYRGYEHRQYNASRAFLEYALTYRLWGNQTFPGYLGGAYRTIVYFTQVDELLARMPTGYILFSLDMHIVQKWIINARNSLGLSVSFPFLGYAVRPPFAMTDSLWEKYLNERTYIRILGLGEMTSFHNFMAIFSGLKYQCRINSLLSLNAGLDLELSRFMFYRQRIDAISRFNAGISFAF